MTGPLDELIARALAEDVGSGDRTTAWTVPPDLAGRGEIRAKAPVVVAGLDAALRVFRAVDPALELEADVADGDEVAPGARVLAVNGALASILTAERTALNFLGRRSGIATLTRAFVRAVAGSSAQVVDTRKTTPGWRSLEKAAVRAGGAANHRGNLSDWLMLKDNHLIGTSIADSLRVHSDTMRIKRRQRAEEAAAKLTVKLLVPLVAFVLPAIFVVILGPGILIFLEFWTTQ